MNVQREKGGDTTIAKVTVKGIVHQKKTTKKSCHPLLTHRKVRAVLFHPTKVDGNLSSSKKDKNHESFRRHKTIVEVQRNKMNMRIGREIFELKKNMALNFCFSTCALIYLEI